MNMDTLKAVVVMVLVCATFSSGCLVENGIGGVFTITYASVNSQNVKLFPGQTAIVIRDPIFQVTVKPMWRAGGMDTFLLMTPDLGGEFVIEKFSITGPSLNGLEFKNTAEFIPPYYYFCNAAADRPAAKILRLPERFTYPRIAGLMSMQPDEERSLYSFHLRLSFPGRIYEIEIKGNRKVEFRWALPGTRI
jgi:hypothetical protein